MIMCVLCYPVSFHMLQLHLTGHPISSFIPNIVDSGLAAVFSIALRKKSTQDRICTHSLLTVSSKVCCQNEIRTDEGIGPGKDVLKESWHLGAWKENSADVDLLNLRRCGEIQIIAIIVRVCLQEMLLIMLRFSC